jgi:TM2 domain-containing membrane protein YozV
MAFCPQCGAKNEGGEFCGNCGAAFSAQAVQAMPQPPLAQQQVVYGYAPPMQSKKTLAGVLGIFLGGFGIHKFVLGYTTEGILMIVITIFTCGIGSILGLVEGIIYLTKSDEEFVQTYQVNKRAWF